MIDVFFVVACVLFACAIACAARAVRHAVRCDLRGVLDDLSGRRRQRGLEEVRQRRVAQGASVHMRVDVTPSAPAGSFELPASNDGLENATELVEDPKTLLDEEPFVLTDRVMLVHAQGAMREEGKQ